MAIIALQLDLLLMHFMARIVILLHSIIVVIYGYNCHGTGIIIDAIYGYACHII